MKLISQLIMDERGATAIYVALGMGVIFGTAGLAIDLTRAMTLETEQQQAADAAALAGAAELDGQDGAIDRARQAAQGKFGTNLQTFSTDAAGAQVSVSEVTFLSSIDPDVTTGKDVEARFIQVRVAPREAAPLLMPVVTGKSDALRIGATATAGFNRVACKIPPLMVCNPWEPSAPTGETPFEGDPGQQILIKSHSGEHGGQWAPGTFGLLDTPDGEQSAQQLAIWLAKGSSPGCYAMKVSVRPGQADAVRTALNTRFDMYENPFFGGPNDKTNPLYRPARNVTKGRIVVPPSGGGGGGGAASPACNTQVPANPQDAMALPRDSCIKAETCRFGDGDWDRTAYWAVNHGIAPPADLATRYQTYRWETDNGRYPDDDPATGTTKENGSAEQGPPGRCYAGSEEPSDTPDRRVLHFAVVNCGYHDIHGNAENIPPVAFVKAFLTEPASDTSDIFLETIEVAKPEVNSSVMHDVIQLYR